jgi:hypothetical protein
MDIVRSEGSINTPGPGLPAVHQEIVDNLINDDWCRFSTDDGKKVFYAIGFETFNEYLRGEEDFLVLDRPETGLGSAEGEREARSQMASAHPDYLSLHKKRFEEATGVPLKEMADWFLNHNFDDKTSEMPHSNLVSDARLVELISERIGAAVASLRQAGQPFQEDEKDRTRVRVGKEKYYLREIDTIYGKMAKRWEKLEMLSFVDPQLQEASRCYLYGFFRAAIVLCAASLEAKLKDASGMDYFEKYSELIDAAVKKSKLDNVHADFARRVFRERNNVAHGGADIVRESVEEVLFRARSVLSFLHSRDAGG